MTWEGVLPKGGQELVGCMFKDQDMSLGCIWVGTQEKDWKAQLEEAFPHQYFKSNEDQKLQSVQIVAQDDSSDFKSQQITQTPKWMSTSNTFKQEA